MPSRLHKTEKIRLEQDLFLIVASIALTIWLVKSGLIEDFIFSENSIHALQSFIAGTFFTSIFTTAPAIAVLGTLAKGGSIFQTAFWGGVGALCGDLVLFALVKNRFAKDLMAVVGKSATHKIKHLFKKKIFRWFSPFVGGLIIASPLPDELGIMLLGISHTNTLVFILFSFIANFSGILAIAYTATTL